MIMNKKIMQKKSMSQKKNSTQNVREKAVVRKASRPTIPMPSMKPRPDGSILISRTEYVRAIESHTSATFINTLNSVNPGQILFPWLSQVADNWSKYCFKKLRFRYKPVVSTANLTGSMGSILIAFNVNAGEPKFNSFADMVEYSGSIERRICDDIIFNVDVRNIGVSDGSLFIRTGGVPSGQDVKTYDIGSLQVATDHLSASSYPTGTLLGHLYVDYEVELFRPRIRTEAIAASGLYALFRSYDPWNVDRNAVSSAYKNDSNTLELHLVNTSTVDTDVSFKVVLPETSMRLRFVFVSGTSTSMAFDKSPSIGYLHLDGYDGISSTHTFVDGGAPTNTYFSGYIYTTDDPSEYIEFSWPANVPEFDWTLSFFEIRNAPADLTWVEYS